MLRLEDANPQATAAMTARVEGATDGEGHGGT